MAERTWHAQSSAEVLETLETSTAGLSQEVARERLERVGPNQIETADVVSPLRILLHQFKSPLIYILLIAFLITIAIDHLTDAIVIAAVLVINATIGFIQEYRAENAMAALAELVSPKARVRRDGQLMEIDSTELVPGDIVRLESGDIVPADIRVIEARDLRVENAILTGESVPVSRQTESVESGAGIGDRTNMVFMGTGIVSGRATGVVVQTGASTEIGHIAEEMRLTQRAPTPLQIRMHRFGNLISLAILGVGVLIFAIGFLQGIPAAEIFLLAVAIAVSAIPEGLPVVMTVALAVSVRRMASRNAIIRRLPAVETLGSCDVIISDKTGTITENQMTVRRIRLPASTLSVTGSGTSPMGEFLLDGEPVGAAETQGVSDLLVAGALANEASISSVTADSLKAIGDPTDVALLVAARKAGLERSALLNDYPERDHRPFESDRRYAASVHETPDGLKTFVKGAPERIIAICDSMRDGDEVVEIDRDRMLEAADSMAKDGLRVIGIAAGAGGLIDNSQPSGLTFLGLVGMIDPPRENVPEAIKACEAAGIRVVMVTGDHAETAQAIGRSIGLSGENVLTGPEMSQLDDEAVKARLGETNICARIDPTQKLRLVSLLQSEGHIVAVTGDGVNDAPALKAAHLGTAMGITGTGVAKEASEMVLTDDNFATIYAAVEEGRTVFANIRKATSFLIATGVGLVLAIVAAFVLALVGILPEVEEETFPLLLLPAQALWLNVVNNGIQDVALAFEPGEAEIFERPPYDPNAGLLSGVLVERTMIVGVWLAILALAVFSWELHDGASIAYSQTTALTMMVISMAMFVGTCRSETRSIFSKSPFSNPLLLVGTITAVSIHIVVLHVGPMQTLLGVVPISLETWLRTLLLAPSVIVIAELHKRWRR